VLFCCLKIFFKFFSESATNSCCVGSYCAERGIEGKQPSLTLTQKGGENMKSSSFEQAIQAQFDCLTKKVIKRAAMKYKRSISRRLQHEIPFSDVSDLELNKAGVYDNYSCDYTVFNVLGMEVQVSDDQLSKALKCLPERKRNIILLSYFMDMSDAEIGELMNVVRSTVYRHRTSTLEEIRKMMEEE